MADELMSAFDPLQSLAFNDDLMVMSESTRHSRWIWVVAILLVLVVLVVVAAMISKGDKRESENFLIAGTLYVWPDRTTVIPPQPTGIYGKGYVRYHPRQSGFRLIYDGNRQEPQNEAGLPDLQLITSRFSKREEFSFHETAVGTVVCHRKLARTPYLFPCGLSFVHRGARWQLQIGPSDVPNTEKIYQDAVASLEAFRSGQEHLG